MNPEDEKALILEQYKTYSDAKDKFIDRQFTTNRFYLVLNIMVLVIAYIFGTLTPQYQPIIVLCVIGITISLMWWMSIDSYLTLIKVKYANVLEYLETKLPEQPYHKEYVDYQDMKKRQNLIMFGDFQKFLALTFAGIYFVVCIYNLTNYVRYQLVL